WGTVKYWHKDARTQVALKNRMEGETICRYWTMTNKVAKPRDMIYALKKSPAQSTPSNPQEATNDPQDGPAQQRETHSKRMAELARDYHENLQTPTGLVSKTVREEKIEKVLGKINIEISQMQKHELDAQISKPEVEDALKRSKNNFAAGLDGATMINAPLIRN
ncbi:hypothetical protein DXG01_004557, partial [Tephrocybe rancida]